MTMTKGAGELDEEEMAQLITRFILEGFSAREIRSFTNAPLERIEAIAHRFAEQERAP